MSDQEIYDLIAEGIEVDPGTLTADTRIADVPEWSSLGWLTIMSLIDERFGLQIPAADIRSFRTAGDLVSYVRSKVGVTG